MSGQMKSSAMSRLFLVLMQAAQMIWSSRSERAFSISSFLAFWGTSKVALASWSSIFINTLFLYSRFSLIIPRIFIFEFAGALNAFLMVEASRASILCLRSFWSFSKRSRKYSRYSSSEPVVQISVVGSSVIVSSGCISFASGWNVFLDSWICDACGGGGWYIGMGSAMGFGDSCCVVSSRWLLAMYRGLSCSVWSFFMVSLISCVGSSVWARVFRNWKASLSSWNPADSVMEMAS